MIILTGGAGFIGSAFLEKLNQQGYRDILVVDQLDGSEKWKNLVGKSYSDYLQRDQFLYLMQENKLPKPAHVIHLGACSSTTETDADYILETNYEFSKVIAQWAFHHKAPILYASSAATYGNGEHGYSDEEPIERLRPLNMYGYSKHMFDLWLTNRAVFTSKDHHAIGLKFFNVFGPNEYHKEEMMSIICKRFSTVRDEGIMRLFKSYHPDYKDGEQKRDFVYIKDVVDVMYYFFTNPDKNGIYNLGTGTAHSWNDIAHAMFLALGKVSSIEYIDMPDYLKPKYQYFTEATMNKVRAAGCDHTFMSLNDAIADYVTYLEQGKTL